MIDKFPARVSKSGPSKVITIPEPVRDNYQIGETVDVILKKRDPEL